MKPKPKANRAHDALFDALDALYEVVSEHVEDQDVTEFQTVFDRVQFLEHHATLAVRGFSGQGHTTLVREMLGNCDCNPLFLTSTKAAASANTPDTRAWRDSNNIDFCGHDVIVLDPASHAGSRAQREVYRQAAEMMLVNNAVPVIIMVG